MNKKLWYSNDPWNDFLRKCMRVRGYVGYRTDSACREAAIKAYNEANNKASDESNKPKR